MQTIPFLAIDRIHKRYGARHALEAVSLDVAQGEFLTLLGPSGSGKSTLLSVLSGFTPPDTGHVRLRGTDITGAPPEQRRFGVVPQGYGLFPHLNVQENVAFPLRVRKTAAARTTARVAEMLELMQIGELRARLPRELSGGQQQRVALARALSFEPDVLLLDEPMSALDALLRRDLHAELKRLHRRVGTTFIYVTHDQQEALALSDRVAVLRDGRLEQVGAPRHLYEQPHSRFVADFLGKNNLLAAHAQGHGFEWAGQSVAAASLARPTGPCVLAVRPEDVRIGKAGHGEPATAAVWRGVVTSQVFHGASSDYTVTIGAATLTVTTPGGAAWPEEGDAVWVALDLERLWRLPAQAAA